MWEYKGIDSSNSFSHGRTKGSKNGISTTAGYKAVGNKAAGIFDPATGRYIYDTAKNAINKISDAGYNVGYKVGSAIGNGINTVRNGVSSLINRNNANTKTAQSNAGGATIRTGENTFTYSEGAQSNKAHGQQYRDSVDEKKAAESRKAHGQQYRDSVDEREAKESNKAHGQQYRNSISRDEEADRQKGIEARGFDPDEVKAKAHGQQYKDLEKQAIESMNMFEKINPNSGAFETARKQFKSDLSKAYESAESSGEKTPSEIAMLYDDQIEAYEKYIKNGGTLTPSQEVALEVVKERFEKLTTPSKDKPYVSKEYIQSVKYNSKKNK